MSARSLVITAYATLVLCGLALVLAGRAGRLGLLPLGEVIDAARASLPGRLLIALAWTWLGWHLLAR